MSVLTKTFLSGLFERAPSQHGLRLNLKFKDDLPAQQAMSVLLDCERQGVVVIDENQKTFVLAVSAANSFSKRDRTVQVWLQHKPEGLKALTRLADYLESVEPADDHLLLGLRSTRGKKRTETAQMIMQTWVSDQTRQALDDWSLTLSDELVLTNDGFHVLELTLSHDDTTVRTYRLDGFSGYLQRDTTWIVGRRASESHLNEHLLADIETYVDAATSPDTMEIGRRLTAPDNSPTLGADN